MTTAARKVGSVYSNRPRSVIEITSETSAPTDRAMAPSAATGARRVAIRIASTPAPRPLSTNSMPIVGTSAMKSAYCCRCTTPTTSVATAPR